MSCSTASVAHRIIAYAVLPAVLSLERAHTGERRMDSRCRPADHGRRLLRKWSTQRVLPTVVHCRDRIFHKRETEKESPTKIELNSACGCLRRANTSNIREELGLSSVVYTSKDFGKTENRAITTYDFVWYSEKAYFLLADRSQKRIVRNANHNH